MQAGEGGTGPPVWDLRVVGQQGTESGDGSPPDIRGEREKDSEGRGGGTVTLSKGHEPGEGQRPSGRGRWTVQTLENGRSREQI